jgi:DNA-binding MarR family transcriptional regulator
MADPFDPSLLAYSRGGAPRRTPHSPRQRRYYFLRGPISWAWLTAAARLPGKTLHVAIVLWFWVGRTNSRRVSISLSAIAQQFCFDRSSASRGLQQLARAGLVSVEPAPGRKHAVTIIDTNDAT